MTIQAQILDLMQQLQQELGMAVIMITHDLGVVAGMADRINVMYAGSHRGDGDHRGAVREPAPPLHARAAALDPAPRRAAQGEARSRSRACRRT